MNSDEFDTIAPGTSVTVYSFGAHKGVVVGKDPEIEIQGRKIRPAGWLKVEIPGKPAPFNEWNGTYRDVEIEKPAAPAGAFNYRVIQAVEGQLCGANLSAEQFYAWLEVRGFKVVGSNSNPRQRAELQGQPIVGGLCGPMWDGDAIRYEDSAANDILSQ